MSGLLQVSGQLGAVGTGALDADLCDLAVLLGPADQLGVACRRSGEPGGAEHPPEAIEGRGDVHVHVGVHADSDGAGRGCDRGHVPCLLEVGWHARPDGRTGQ